MGDQSMWEFLNSPMDVTSEREASIVVQRRIESIVFGFLKNLQKNEIVRLCPGGIYEENNNNNNEDAKKKGKPPGKGILSNPVVFGRTFHILSFVHGLVVVGRKISQRDLYYENVLMYPTGAHVAYSDIRAVAKLLCVSRTCLNIYASSRGSVVGRLRIRDPVSGQWEDCSAIGKDGRQIKGDQSDLRCEMESDARYIIVVEKEGIFDELSTGRFFAKLPSIIVTARGIPDVASRAFVAHLAQRFRLPVLGIADWNAGGAMTLAMFKYGSFQSSLCSLRETAALSCPEMVWIGLNAEDVRDLPNSVKDGMSEQDKRRVSSLLEKKEFDDLERTQLEKMYKMGVKVELQALRTVSSKANALEGWIANKVFSRMFVEQ